MSNKRKYLFIVLCILFGKYALSQTLYVPSGTGGISNVTNGTTNVGVGLSTPQAAFHIYTPNSAPFYIQRDNSSQGNLWAFRVTSGDASYGINPRSLYIHSGQYDADIAFGPRNAAPDFIIKKNGYVGIGKTSPGDKLDIRGKLRLTSIRTSDARDYGLIYSTYGVENTLYKDVWPDKHERAFVIQAEGYVDGSNAGGSGIQFWTKDKTGPLQAMVIRRDGKVGIGTSSPNFNLDVHGSFAVDSYGSADYGRIELRGNVGAYIDFTQGTHDYDGRIIWNLSNNERFNIYGNVKFMNNIIEDVTVDGKLIAEEVKVQTVPSSDFVFEPDYNLKSLQEVESFIQQNKHLPDIPSAEEFKENGVGLGEMDDMLLRKIEELTLYMIELKKADEQKDQKIMRLEEENQNLKADLLKEIETIKAQLK